MNNLVIKEIVSDIIPRKPVLMRIENLIFHSSSKKAISLAELVAQTNKKYGADYNSLNRDYNERQMSDGSEPDIRDPKRTYLICKHIAACVPLFKKFIIPSNFK